MQLLLLFLIIWGTQNYSVKKSHINCNKNTTHKVNESMLTRYKVNDSGKNVPIAHIYDEKEHNIKQHLIDADAIWVIRKLASKNHTAYLVGGAVRDLMLGNTPKDFDIVTSARPRQIQKLFYNARIIGKRFKLVHLTFRDKIIEVSTFRSGIENPEDPSDIYGNIEQDSARRDFTVNALYYDPLDRKLLDFNHAMRDFKKKKIASVLPLSTSFKEDPVRMIRAVKYSVTTGFALSYPIKRAIKRDGHELIRISSSRITEEVMKILSGGHSHEIISHLQKQKILIYLLPSISISEEFPEVLNRLKVLDRRVGEVKTADSSRDSVTRGEMISCLAGEIALPSREEEENDKEYFQSVFRHLKQIIQPITPANYDVEYAAAEILQEIGISVPSSWYKSRVPAYYPGRTVQKHKAKKTKQPPRPRGRRKKAPNPTPQSQG